MLCSLLVRLTCALCLCSSSTDESDRIDLTIGSSGCMNTDGRDQVFSGIPEAVLQKVDNDLMQIE